MKKVGIIGGGIVGTNLAYYLSLHKGVEVTLLEKNQIGSGETAKSAGTLCLIDDSLPDEYFEQRISCIKTYKKMHEDTHGEAEFRQSGTLVVSPTDKELARAKKHVELSIKHGFSAEFINDPCHLKDHLPDLVADKTMGGAWTAEDGYVNPTAASLILARWARERGVKIVTGANVVKIPLKGGKVSLVETSKGNFEFDVVIDAAGPWAMEIGKIVGLDLPMHHTKAEVFILKPAKPLGYKFPILKYPTWYARAEGDAVFVCKSHMAMDANNPIEAGVWDPDLLPLTGGTEEYFFDFITKMLSESLPKLLDAELVNDWLGYRSVTKDKLPILGESGVPGFLLAIGMSGNGVILGPDTGRALANYIAKDEKDPLLEKFKLGRFK
jgi:glycine/D-amino acid oxidase-like deaminating enzyme